MLEKCSENTFRFTELPFCKRQYLILSWRLGQLPAWVGQKTFVILPWRLPDFRRAERIESVRQIIVNHTDPSVYCFYHKESNAKRDIRLYLWAHKDDFVVILQKLGRGSAFLVTIFYVDHQRKREDFTARYQRYISGTAQELANCNWF